MEIYVQHLNLVALIAIPLFDSIGKKAIMTVYEDGVEKEVVELYKLKTKEQMHAKMVDLGFKKKGSNEIAQDRMMAMTDKVLAQEVAVTSNMSRMNGIFAVVGVLFFLVANFRRRKRTKRSILPMQQR